MGTPESWIELGRRGAFTSSQVAVLVGTTPEKVVSWLGGSPPLILSDLPTVAGRIAISFDGLIEARAVAHLLSEGAQQTHRLTRRRLARVMEVLRQRTGDRHPLARDRDLITNGLAVFELSDGKIINLLNDCYASTDLIGPSLRGRVEFKGGRAAWLEPYPNDLPLVRIEPARAFGRPVVVDMNTTVPTETLASAARADTPAEAADWYGVSEDAVDQAVEFEDRIAA
ncbi:MAG: hypothetical protein WDN45_00180 [Caulobacteraceae bacterium]